MLRTLYVGPAGGHEHARGLAVATPLPLNGCPVSTGWNVSRTLHLSDQWHGRAAVPSVVCFTLAPLGADAGHEGTGFPGQRDTQPSLDGDDDDIPPGFGPHRAEQLTAYACKQQIAPSAAPVQLTSHAAQYSDTFAHQSLGSKGSSQTRSLQSNYLAASVPGGVRQFQQALSSSLNIQKAAGQPVAQQPACSVLDKHNAAKGTHCWTPASAAEPDYGDVNDDDADYGASTNTRKQHNRWANSQGGVGPSSHSSNYSNLQACHNHNKGSLSHSSSHSSAHQHQRSLPAAYRQRRYQQQQHQTTLPAPLLSHCSANCGRTGTGSLRFASSKPTIPSEPDYEDDNAQYGSSRGEAGSSCTRLKRHVLPADEGQQTPNSHVSPAATGSPVHAGKGRGGRRGQPRRHNQDHGEPSMPPEQVAALKDQIAALRAQLTEAEARDMETQMTMMTLESSNSTLQKQLKDIRTQKQQLEMQLLFGGEQPSREGS
eukprot:GHRR01019603.1.p1 GENE.GHRR01019603.1~~GHRR01019603.1.p1  ORF type:complete len:484 (+),score=154.54 GHRR01019603.1:710-2161(+)